MKKVFLLGKIMFLFVKFGPKKLGTCWEKMTSHIESYLLRFYSITRKLGNLEELEVEKLEESSCKDRGRTNLKEATANGIHR